MLKTIPFSNAPICLCGMVNDDLNFFYSGKEINLSIIYLWNTKINLFSNHKYAFITYPICELCSEVDYQCSFLANIS